LYKKLAVIGLNNDVKALKFRCFEVEVEISMFSTPLRS